MLIRHLFVWMENRHCEEGNDEQVGIKQLLEMVEQNESNQRIMLADNLLQN